MSQKEKKEQFLKKLEEINEVSVAVWLSLTLMALFAPVDTDDSDFIDRWWALAVPLSMIFLGVVLIFKSIPIFFRGKMFGRKISIHIARIAAIILFLFSFVFFILQGILIFFEQVA